MDHSFEDEFVQDERRSLSRLQETVLFGAARHWGWIVGATFLGAVIGLYLGASKPNTYLSTAKLRLVPGQRELLSEESQVGITNQRESSLTMANEIHLLTDRAVFENTIRELGPDVFLQPEDPTRYDDPDSTPLVVQWMHQLQSYLIQSSKGSSMLDDFDEEGQVQIAAEVLIRDTVVFPNTGSNFITILHTSTSPEKAQRNLAHFVDACLTQHRRQFSTQRYIPRREELVEEARTRYLAAKNALDEFSINEGFADLDLERKNGHDNLGEIEKELTVANRNLRSKQAELAKLQDSLAAERGGRLDGATMSEIRALEIPLASEVAGLVEAVEELDRARRVQDERVKELAALAPRLRELSDEFEAAQASYEAKRNGLDELTSLAEIDDSNLSVITLPTLAIEKEGPKRFKLLTLGVVAGFAVGLLFVVLRQAFDVSLRYPSTVQRWSGLQLLAVIPESPDVRRLQRVRHFI